MFLRKTSIRMLVAPLTALCGVIFVLPRAATSLCNRRLLNLQLCFFADFGTLRLLFDLSPSPSPIAAPVSYVSCYFDSLSLPHSLSFADCRASSQAQFPSSVSEGTFFIQLLPQTYAHTCLGRQMYAVLHL